MMKGTDRNSRRQEFNQSDAQNKKTKNEKKTF